MKLYEIDNEIMNCFDDNEEIIDKAKFEKLSMARDEKIEKVALWYKNLIADAKAYKEEKDNFAEREKRAKNKAESLKEYLKYALEGENLKTSKVNISYRNSKTLEILDIAKVGLKYVSYEPKVDKKSITQALKDGKLVDGVELVEKSNIQIK